MSALMNLIEKWELLSTRTKNKDKDLQQKLIVHGYYFTNHVLHMVFICKKIFIYEIKIK